MKNRSKILMLFGALMAICFGVQNVSAATLTKTDTSYHYERKPINSNVRTSDILKNYSVDGEVAYCIEPGVPEGTNDYNAGTWADTGLSNDIKDKVLLTAYYGYQYNGHQTQKFRAAAQAIIWETIMGEGSWVKFNTDFWSKGTNIDVSAERAEIENLIAHHYDKPAFNGSNYTGKVGVPIKITDTNGVLSNYDVRPTDNAKIEVNGNELTVTPTKSGNINIIFVKKLSYVRTYLVYYSAKHQNLLSGGNVDPILASVNITADDSSVSLTKKDSETGSIAQGQATLKGAVYGVFTLNDELIGELTTDENGYATNKVPMEMGTTYVLKEKVASEGYYLDQSRHEFTFNGDDVSLNVKEVVVKNYISILKQYDYVDGNTTILHPESNITFDIFYPDGRKFDTIVTDKNGYASLNIPYGRWRFHQVNTNDGFSKINDFYVTVDYNSKKEQYYNILNNKLNAYLQVIKKDSETGKNIAIADTTFKILNLDTNQYVSQYVAGKVYSEFKTDENGVFTTYLKLEAGNYRLIETGEPNGYLLDVKGLDFSIGNNTNYYYTDYGATVVVEFENTPIKGVLEINKTGESVKVENGSFTYESIALDNIVFDIYADEDILTADGQHLYYHKGDKVDTLITNKYGYAISKELPLGKYFAVEISTKDCYVLDSTEYHFILSKIDNQTAIVYKTHSKLNHLKKSELDFTKTDLVDDEPIEGALIELYTENGDLIYSGRTNKEGKINFTFTDLDGNELKNTLPFGKYYILEKEAPYNYLLNEDKIWFEVTEDGEIIKANMKDKRVEGSILIHKDGEKYSISELCEDPSKCFIYETDENLEGIKYGLYAREDIILNNITRFEAGELVAEGYTDELGNLVFDHLYLGKYFIKELETKEFYVLDEKEYDFELKYVDSKTPIVETSYTLKNFLIKSDLEFTKVSISDGKPLPDTLVEIYQENGELIFSGRSDEEGKIILKDIPVGKYYILEKEAPESYVVNEEPMWFEVTEDGEIIKATMEDEKIKSTIIIHKVNQDGKGLAGVTIGIYDLEGNLVYEGITNEDGNIEVEMEYGKYYWQEIATIDNYVLSEEKVYFDVTEHGAVIEDTLVNIEVPNTSSNTYINLIGGLVVVIGIGFILISNRNNKKKH